MVVLDVRHSDDSVALVIGLSFIGIYAAVSLCEQYRLATLSTKKKKRLFVLFLVAVGLAWTCTWSVHAVGAASLRLYHGDELVPYRFNAAIVLLAGVQSVLQTYIGLYITAQDDCFNNTRTEIMEKFIARTSSTLTLEEIKRMSKYRILFIVLTHSVEKLHIGGLFGGAGISACHFLVLHSMQFQGTIEYHPGMMVVAFLFSMFNGTGGFWAFFRLLSLFPGYDFARILNVLIGVVAVCGMHFIGMQAVTFHYDPTRVHRHAPTDSLTIAPGRLYSGAIGASVLCFVTMMMFVIYDLRAWLMRTSAQLRQADKAIISLVARSSRHARRDGNAELPEVARYAKTYLSSPTDAVSTHTGPSNSTDQPPPEPTPGRGSMRTSWAASRVRVAPRRLLYNNYFEDDDNTSTGSGNNSNANNSVSLRQHTAESQPHRPGTYYGAYLTSASELASGEDSPALYERLESGEQTPVPPTLDQIVEAGLQAHSQRILLGNSAPRVNMGSSQKNNSGRGMGMADTPYSATAGSSQRTAQRGLSGRLYSAPRIVPTTSDDAALVEGSGVGDSGVEDRE